MSPKLRALSASKLPLIAIVVAAGELGLTYSAQATQWAVMTDELQTEKLATSIARTFSPAPRIHGRHYGGVSQLYPLVLAPLYGLLSTTAAFTAAHALNAFLLASAAWPAYLLGRAVTGSRAGGYFAASLTAFGPWLVLSSTLLTENVAYPAFVWGVLLVYRATAEPSLRHDAAALAGLVLVFLARTQLFVLAVALPVAVLAHELGLRRGLRRLLADHRLLAVVYAMAAAAATLLAAFGSLERVFGNYAETLHGNPFPAGIWHAAVVHLDYMVVGAGVVPFLLAAAWSLAAVLRPLRHEAHAFAALFLVLVPLVTLEAASFDLRFTPGRFVQDRYVCYLVPLFTVGAAASLLEPLRRVLDAVLVLAMGVAFFGLASLASWGTAAVVFWASPAAAFQPALRTLAGDLGLGLENLVRFGGLLLAAALAAALWRLPSRATLAVAGLAVTAFGVAETVYVFDWFALPLTTRTQAIVGVRRDWIDAAVPDGASVGLVPTPEDGPDYWWDAEFWNKTVDRVLRVDGRQTFTPFPSAGLSFDRRTGRAHGAESIDFLVLDATKEHFGLAGARRVSAAKPLTLVRFAKPVRALWVVDGVDPDGWTRSGRPVEIRLFSARELVLTLRAPKGPTRFTVRSAGVDKAGLVPGRRVVRLRVPVCVPRGGFRLVTLVARGGVRLPDGRAVAGHLDGIRTRRLSGACG